MTAALPDKCLIILLDGLADRAWPELGGRTPLEAALTPALDALAAQAACGHWHAASPGRALPSELAHFLMMGYGEDQFPGRGWLEALGHGIEAGPGDVCILARLAVCIPRGGGLLVEKRKPRLGPEEHEELWALVADYEGPHGRAKLRATGPGQGILVLEGDLAPWVSDADPMAEGMPLPAPVVWAEHRGDAKAESARALLVDYLRWAHQRLEGRKVNAVITHRAGQARPLPTLRRMWGLECGSVSSHPLYKGIFQAMGAETLLLPDERVELSAHAKLTTALHMLERRQLVHVHFKEPDDAAHRGDPMGKARLIQDLDRALAPALEAIKARGDVLICLTGDHATPSGGRMIHAGQPSPLLLWGPGQWRDGVPRFDEVNCAAGSLGLLRGRELMQTILCSLDRAALAGLRQGPDERPFAPCDAPPLAFE